jgi:hypothetical protein
MVPEVPQFFQVPRDRQQHKNCQGNAETIDLESVKKFEIFENF